MRIGHRWDVKLADGSSPRSIMLRAVVISVRRVTCRESTEALAHALGETTLGNTRTGEFLVAGPPRPHPTR